MTPQGAPDRGITVVLPVYRNRPQLPELTSRLTEVLDAAVRDVNVRDGTATTWEIVFVDDCGGDGAREWIEERGRGDERLRLAANAANVGQHASVLAGLRAARGERIVVMDADLQDAPEDIPTLLAPLGPGAAAVFARRGADSAASARSCSGRAFKSVLRGISGSRIPEGTGMFLAMRRDARDAVVALASDRPYVPFLLSRTGLPLAAVDVTRHARSAGGSSYTWHRRLRMGIRATGQAIWWRLLGR